MLVRKVFCGSDRVAMSEVCVDSERKMGERPLVSVPCNRKYGASFNCIPTRAIPRTQWSKSAASNSFSSAFTRCLLLAPPLTRSPLSQLPPLASYKAHLYPSMKRRAIPSALRYFNMLFAKALLLLSLHATRQLSRFRPTTVIILYLSFSLVLVYIVYLVTTTLLLFPLASYLFRYHKLHASPRPPHSGNQPPAALTHAIGALPSTPPRPINYSSLPLHRPEADLLLSYLQPQHTFLEFGASATTVTFPLLVNQSYSIEHDPQICDLISSQLSHIPKLHSKLRAFCVPIQPGHQSWGLTSPLEEGSYQAFHSYVDVPRTNLSSHLFDRVLINGRARVACALRILPHLHDRSLVFFHDFFLRPVHYAHVLPYYEEIARIVAHAPVTGYTDDPVGLLVLRPRKGFTGSSSLADISEARIHAIYDTYEEKEPTAGNTGFELAVAAGLQRTDEGGFDYYKLADELNRKTSKARLVLDILMLAVVAFTYWLLRVLFRRMFLEALSLRGGYGVRARRTDVSLIIPLRSDPGGKQQSKVSAQGQGTREESVLVDEKTE
eukprot:GFKZ01009649.1.p1 GENE.GFKZ01009649.1~~GFKZ01009649.1.p1  ORF type:complete len:551 (-),score=58.77 GFKZ01009649.1:1084-2736(-)